MIEIKSDMMGYLQNICNQVMFDSQTTVIDELVQNCKRAGANYVGVYFSW